MSSEIMTAREAMLLSLREGGRIVVLGFDDRALVHLLRVAEGVARGATHYRFWGGGWEVHVERERS
jgi:hypothetical protein